MNGVDAPNRMAWKSESDALVGLDRATGELLEASPTELRLGDIREAPAVFQVRYESLAFAPGHSAKHIEGLTRALRNGGPLDPVSVVAFGNEWYLVDGHHRLQAYRRAEWNDPIPTTAHTSVERGLARIHWAQALSLAENKKDRLNISPSDRQDAAWRRVLQGHGSISEISSASGISTRTVSNMREAKKVLVAAGGKIPRLTSFGWRQAINEVRKLESGDEGADFDFHERRQRELAKRIKLALDLRPSAELLLEVLEASRPGISIELETALEMADESRRDSELEI